MKPILSIVGRKNSGKTTLLECLISGLTERGYRVGVIKHDVHGFEFDHPGKDTYRHKEAGAKTVVISSKDKLGMISDLKKEMSVPEIAEKFFSDVDIVLTEGYKSERMPKIEVQNRKEDLLCKDDETLIAIVADEKYALNVPCFQWDEMDRLRDFIIENFIKK